MGINWAEMMATKGRDIPTFVYYVVADSHSFSSCKIALFRVLGEKTIPRNRVPEAHWVGILQRILWDGGLGSFGSDLNRRVSCRKSSCCLTLEEAKARIRASTPRYIEQEKQEIAKYKERIQEFRRDIATVKARITALQTLDIQDEVPPGFDEEHIQDPLSVRAEAEARALGFANVADLLASPNATAAAKVRMDLYQKAIQKATEDKPEAKPGPAQPDRYDRLGDIL